MKLGLIAFTTLSVKLTHLNVFMCYDLSLNDGNRKYAIKLYTSVCTRRVWKNFALAKRRRVYGKSVHANKKETPKSVKRRIEREYEWILLKNSLRPFSVTLVLIAGARKAPDLSILYRRRIQWRI